MHESKSELITREILLDPYIEVLVGVAPNSLLSDTGCQDILRITVVDRFHPHHDPPAPLERTCASKDAEARLKSDSKDPMYRQEVECQFSKPFHGRSEIDGHIGHRVGVSWFAWLVNAARRSGRGQSKFSRDEKGE